MVYLYFCTTDTKFIKLLMTTFWAGKQAGLEGEDAWVSSTIASD